MKAIIISLNDPDEARNLALRKILEKNEIEAEVLPATNGRLMSATAYFQATRSYLRVTGQTLTPAEVGCSMSHTQAHEKILDEGLSCALILEDDAIVNDVSCTAFKWLMNSGLHKDGLIHLGGQDGIERSILSARGRRILGSSHVWDVNPDDWRRVYRTVGYIVSLEHARRLHEFAQRGAFLSDDFTYSLRGIGCNHLYFCNCVSHPIDLSRSSIETERLQSRHQSSTTGRLLNRIVREIIDTIRSRIEDWKRSNRAKQYEPISIPDYTISTKRNSP